MKNLWLGIGVAGIAALAVAVVLINGPKNRESKETRIGAILPLTGENALMGEWGTNGMRLAEEYINSQMPKGDKVIRILIEDGMANPQVSLGAFKKLTEIDQVQIVLSIVSSVDLSLVPAAKKSGVLFFSHATHPKLTAIGPLVFRHSPTVEQEVGLISGFVQPNVETVVLAYMNDDYGTVLRELLDDAFQKKGGRKTAAVMFEKSESDFRALATKLLQQRPQLIIISGTGRNLGQLIVKLKEMGYQGQILVTLGFIVTGAVKAASDSIKGAYGIDFEIDTTATGYGQINQLYRSKYGSDIPTGALLFFNSVLLLKDAIDKVGCEPLQIAKYLRQLRTYQGMGERMEILETNDITPSLKLVRF